MKPKKIPLRKCLGCQERFEKHDLIRVVKQKDGSIFIDKTGKANGRGAYLCNHKACLEMALKRRSIERTLEGHLSEKLKQELLEEIDE